MTLPPALPGDFVWGQITPQIKCSAGVTEIAKQPLLTGEHQRPSSAHDVLPTDVEVTTAFEVFGSELPEEAFEGVLDQPRPIYKPVNWSFRGS
ncbi:MULTISPECIES: hypothetical protein [Bradyrhizobium]|uniref:hypothetical protein n=1 Tax=Bradyrhizobium TaxID=374 RepID=UPI0012FCB97E|nr:MULTISPECIES: hypothetical protein [unclassified Bradyrhizobium]